MPGSGCESLPEARARQDPGPQAVPGSSCHHGAHGAVPVCRAPCLGRAGLLPRCILNVGSEGFNLSLALSLRCQGIKRHTYPKLCRL